MTFEIVSCLFLFILYFYIFFANVFLFKNQTTLKLQNQKIKINDTYFFILHDCNFDGVSIKVDPRKNLCSFLLRIKVSGRFMEEKFEKLPFTQTHMMT